MKPYCNTTTYALRYSDLDFKDELTFTALLSIVQEAACMSADELGFGYEALKPKNYGFIIVNTYCEFIRPIRLGDVVTVETWPLPPRHVIFERDYRVSGKTGEVLAALASRWCLVDLENFSLLTADKMGEVHENCPYRDEKTVEVPRWKIEKLGENGREVYRTTVRASHCDHYLHANNARYADFFMDCFTMDELAARPVKSFQIAYAKQAKEGKELILRRGDFGAYSVCEAWSDGELLTQFRIDFADPAEEKA